MSALGDYIHASLSGYRLHGTKRFDSKYSDFNEKIFQLHEKAVVKQIQQAGRKFTSKKLKNMEDNYNNLQKSTADLIKNLVNDKSSNQTKLKALLKAFNSKWNDQVINDIIQALKWDENRETLIYSPSEDRNKIYLSDSEYSTLPKIAEWKATAKDGKTQSRYLGPLLKSIKNLSTFLKDNYEEASIKDRQTLEKISLTLEAMKKTGSTLQEINDNSTFAKQFEEVRMLRDNANRIRFNYADIEQVNQIIQTQLAEFLGNGIGKLATDIGQNNTEQELVECFKKYFIGRSTGNNSSPNYKIATLNFKEAKIEWEKGEGKSKSQTQILTRSLRPGKENEYIYKFSAMGEPRAQKADIVVDLGVKGVSKPVAISMKYISSSTGKIQGQDSSLMLYLLGASESYKETSNIGTHYLNIFSKHESGAKEDSNLEPSNDDVLTSMREDARRALSLHIMYSAFSGWGQLRNKQQQAKILAIYNKDKIEPGIENRVRFYSIPDLVLKIWNSRKENQVLKPMPGLGSQLFTNEYEVEYEDFPRRITKVLIEARKQTINASVSMALIRRLYNLT